MGVIYKITNPKGKIYIGQTVNYQSRVKRYRWLNCGKQRMLHNSFIKYGFNAHVFDILEDDILPELLNEREMFWISKLNSYYKDNRNFGMNLNRGGNTPVWDSKRVEDFSEKFKGERNPFYGRTHTKENRKKFSENTKEQLRKSGYRISRESIEKGLAAVRKAVVVYDENGHFLNEYDSISECSNSISFAPQTIMDSLRDGVWVGGKYLCKYKTDDYPLVISVNKPKPKHRAIICFIDNIMVEYESAKDAELDLGVAANTIRKSALDSRFVPMRSGYIVIYRDLFEKSIKDAIAV